MAWTTPRTWTGGETLTAALLNTHLRDNFNELDVAKITTYGGYPVTTGVNALTERSYGFERIDTSQTRTLSTYGDLATVGPTVTLTTGTSAVIFITAQQSTDATGSHAKSSYAISGATTSAADNARALVLDGIQLNSGYRAGTVDFRTDLTAGSNTFTMKYASDGTNTASFASRILIVIPL